MQKTINRQHIGGVPGGRRIPRGILMGVLDDSPELKSFLIQYAKMTKEQFRLSRSFFMGWMKEDVQEIRRDIIISYIGGLLVRYPLEDVSGMSPKMIDDVDRFIEKTPFKNIIYVDRETRFLRYHEWVPDETKLAVAEMLRSRGVCGMPNRDRN